MKIVGHVPGSGILENIEIVRDYADLGIGMEIQLTSKVLDTLTLESFGFIRRVASDKVVTVHAPFLDLNPGALDPYVLSVTKRRFRETLEVAKILSAEIVVFHSGYHPLKVGPFYRRWLKKTVETFREIAELASCRIAIENVFDRTPGVLKDLLKRLPEKVGACIDVGHINMFSEVPLGDWLAELEGRIYEFHVHDNDRSADSHLPVGAGTIDFEAFFDVALKNFENAIFNLENKKIEHVRESLDALRRMGIWK